MNLPLASSLAIAGLLTSPFLSAAPQEDKPPAAKQRIGIPESEVGLSIFVPNILSARDLLRYSKEMTEGHFTVQLPNGEWSRRDRFIDMFEGIGIQGTETDRARLTAMLADLDARIGAVKGAAENDQAPEVRTMRMKCMGIESAVTLVNNLGLPVQAVAVRETGNLILKGQGSALDQVQKILGEADRPLPQLIMHCEVIEAVTPDNSGRTENHSAKKKMPQLLSGDVAEALEAINPGKKFARRAHLMLRSSIGGQQPIEITSGIPKSFGDEGDSPSDPRLTFGCVPSGWDPGTQTLTLDTCSVLLEVPTYQSLNNGRDSEPIKQFNGYIEQGISSRLSLKAGETTVIGSLGGDPVYVALRFTVR